MRDWWDSLETGDWIAIVGIFVAVIGVLVTGRNKKGNTITQTIHGNNGNVTNQQGKNNTFIQNQTINNGLTLEEYEEGLKRREKEIRAELEQAHAADRQVLERELSDIQQQLQDTTASYEAHIVSLKERIAQLEKLRDEFPDKVLDQAIEALRQGETEEADRLFQQVEEDSEKHIKRAAEAAFQRGKIAEEAIRYTNALEHYERSVQLQPDNPLYLNDAGVLLYKLGFYHKAIKYFEQVLASFLKTYGEDHPSVATSRNNLGMAWKTLGEYEKAIGYYERALASFLKIYGEDHPSVATSRNNLGGAWHALGENEKAIGYYEQALASDLKTYGENHPSVARDRNNLGMVWDSLGQYEKAIGYFEQALPTMEKFLGKDHPDTKTVKDNLDRARAALGN
ncbi:MAG: tetratricopeptide repeat protein [Burkholderiales bacterium]|nr:tetratricopeptide repeat protein [Burkholderiales bacterium]MDR4517742.1 tetratricopeptide repeat protein [Nitrosomonas sp.]